MAKQKRKTTRNIDATPKQNAAAIANLAGDVADLIKSHTELRRLIEAVDRKSSRAFAAAQGRDLQKKLTDQFNKFEGEIKSLITPKELPKNPMAALRRIAKDLERLSNVVENYIAENDYE